VTRPGRRTCAQRSARSEPKLSVLSVSAAKTRLLMSNNDDVARRGGASWMRDVLKNDVLRQMSRRTSGTRSPRRSAQLAAGRVGAEDGDQKLRAGESSQKRRPVIAE